MTDHWGRLDTAGTWPRPKPVWTLALILLAILSGVATEAYRYTDTWTPLQRVYFQSYLRSAIVGGLGLATGRYQTLTAVDRTGRRRLVLDEEVQPVTTDPNETTFLLSAAGVAAGDRALAWQQAPYAHAKLHAWLAQWIYRDQTLSDLAMPAVWASLIVFGVGVPIAVPKDLARAKARRHGRRLKGPELVPASVFNRRLRSDGIGFTQVSRLFRRLVRRPTRLQLPRHLESSHLLIMGDTGSGKTSLIRQILTQLEARGDTAILYDPAHEYTPEFYRPERGDQILNPLDTRCPFWSPGDEVRHAAEALTVATSLFPGEPGENPFFTKEPRRIIAYLLTHKPTAAQLADWLREEHVLEQLLRGTARAHAITPGAAGQRGGVLSSINSVADTLNLIPPEAETTQRWSTTAWAARRQGWLFLTSTSDTRESLLPITSLWLDLLVLRLMTRGDQPTPRAVWFVLDELQTLQRLPQLHTAVTENRKSNNPLILGFQGRSQLEERYGRDAETMLSQPATKIFMKTGEPHAAKWISETIGEIEIERLRESRSNGPGSRQSYGLERQVEPLVMASEIEGLTYGKGYLKLGNLVVRLQIPYRPKVIRQPAYLERTFAPLPPPIVSPPSDPPAREIVPRDRTPNRPSPASGQGHESFL